VRGAQIVLGSLACGVLVLAGRAFFSRRAGLAAGLLVALYPPAIFFDALIQKANLGLVFMALLLLALGRASLRASARLGLAGGALMGLLALTREESVLLVPLLGLWWGWGPPAADARERARRLGAYALGLALVLAPVAARNAWVGGELVLTTAQAGPNFYIGNGPRAVGIYVPLRPERSDTSFERADAVELAEAALGRELSAREVSRYWTGQALRWIREHPAAWLGLMLRKLALLLNWYEVPDAEDLYFFERSSLVLRLLGRVLHWGVLLPLAGAAVVLTWSRRRELAALYLVLATLACGPVVFYLMARYRYPLVPGLALLAGAGLVEAGRLARGRRWRALLAPGLLLAVLLVLCNLTIYPRDFQDVQSHHNAGAALEDQGQLARAAGEFREALRLDPGLHSSWSGLAHALARLGRDDEAIAAWERARALRADDWRSPWQIGRIWLERGEFGRALGPLRLAAETPGAGAEAWKSLAVASQNLGRWRGASEAWHRALEIEPDDVDARLQLAFLLATCPDPAWRDGARALALVQPIAERAPAEDLRRLDVLAAALAENGRFEEALATLRRARALALETGAGAQLPALREREQAYTEGRPYRPTN
jgi:tetratricopeptide (TPR) repeat protein